MRLRALTTLAFSSVMLFACSDTGTKHDEKTTEIEVTDETTNYIVDVETSNVSWRGEVAGVYGHEGNIDLQGGVLTFSGENLTGGEFTIDMTTIVPKDDGSFTDEEGHRIVDLQGHLTTEDFFATETYPTSIFVITNVNGNTVTGNLTIRDKTNEETFEISSIDVSDDAVNITGVLIFDRQMYDVAWVHYMKDMVLADDIPLTISMVGIKK